MVEIEAGCEGRPGLATLERSDSALVAQMFRLLSAQSIYWRFFSPISRPDLLQRSVQQVDHRDREAVGAVVGGQLVGIAQYVRRPGEKQAQLAIVIVDEPLPATAEPVHVPPFVMLPPEMVPRPPSVTVPGFPAVAVTLIFPEE